MIECIGYKGENTLIVLINSESGDVSVQSIRLQHDIMHSCLYSVVQSLKQYTLYIQSSYPFPESTSKCISKPHALAGYEV